MTKQCPDPVYVPGTHVNSDEYDENHHDAKASIFTSEDPRVMPFSDSDIELINRLESELWFGKR